METDLSDTNAPEPANKPDTVIQPDTPGASESPGPSSATESNAVSAIDRPQPEQEQPGWQFNPGEAVDPGGQPAAPGSQRPPSAVSDVSWTASEFIAHQKSAGWYWLLALAAVAASAAIYLLTRDVISVGIILLAAVTLGIFAARKPRTLEYQVDNSGIHIGSKSYPYADFKSFSVVDEGGVSSIMLMPLKRFMPPITMYYDHKDEDRVVDTLNSYLPYEEHKPDVVDNFMRRIRF